MKYFYPTLSMLALGLLLQLQVFAQCTSTGAGNWTDPSRWAGTCTGPGGIPGATDSIIINDNMVLNMDFTLAATGWIEIKNVLNIENNDTLFNYGNIVGSGGINMRDDGVLINYNSLNIAGMLDMEDDPFVINYGTLCVGEGDIDDGATIILDGGYMCKTSGSNFNMDGDFTIANGGVFEIIGGDLDGDGDFTGDGTGGIQICSTMDGGNFGTTGTVNYCTLCGGTCSSCGGFTNSCAGALPVELGLFDATCHNGMAIVQWTTFSETNSSYFEVERSVDGSAPYTVLGRVAGQGTSNALNEYSFTSAQTGGTQYYRLKQVDNNGSFTYYGPVALRCGQPEEPTLSVFPNPIKHGRIFFTLSQVKGNNMDISIVDRLGKVVYSTKIEDTSGSYSNSIRMDDAGLAAGMYYLVAHSDGQQLTAKFSKTD